MRRLLLLLASLVLVFACSKENTTPEVTISTPTENSVRKDGGTVVLEFASAIEWTATSSAQWATLSQSKGDGGERITISITCAKNDTYDDRSATVTIKSGGTLSKSISISQSAADGLIVSSNRLDLSNSAQDVTITLQKNVEYTYTINGDWISKKEPAATDTKGLASESLVFSIKENTTYDNREGSITFKSAKGDLTSTVKIYQSQVNAIIISSKEVNVDFTAQTIEVALKTNVSVEVSIPEAAKSWVSQSTAAATKALEDKTFYLAVTENAEGAPRSAEITFKNTATGASDVLKLSQNGKEGVFIIGEKSIQAGNAAGSTEITLFHSGEIKAVAKDSWLKVEAVESADKYSTKYKISWEENTGDEERESSVLFQDSANEEFKDLFTVTQKGSAGFLTTTLPGIYNISADEPEAILSYDKFAHQLSVAPGLSGVKGFFRMVDLAHSKFLSLEEIPAAASLETGSEFEAVLLQNAVENFSYSQKITLKVSKIKDGLMWLVTAENTIGFIIQIQ